MEKIICRIGKYDIPVIQRQPDFNVDLLKSNIILFGSPQSGKTNLIKLIINILHKKMQTTNEQIFILDFGGALSEYKNMPLVSAYFDNSNEEYVKRVFKILETKMKDNTKKLGGTGFSKIEESIQPEHITFFIDNFNAFLDEPRYSGYQEKFSRICRDGISKGISIVVSASETKGVMSYMNYFPQKIAVNLTDEKYSEIFGRKVSSIGNIAGRGFANITLKDEKEMKGVFDINCPYEIHCSFAEDIKSPEFKKHLEDKFHGQTVMKYKIFSSGLTEKEYNNLTGKSIDDDYKSLENSEYKYIAGLDYIDFQKVTVDFKESRFLAVYAKKDFGRKELIERITERLMNSGKRKLVLFDDGRHQLEDLHKKYPDAEYISKFDETDVRIKNKDKPRVSAESPIMSKVRQANPVSEWITQRKKLSPMQLFYKYVHENCLDIGNNAIKIYTDSDYIPMQERSDKIPPGCINTGKDPTVFVIQSKLAYSTVPENKKFMENVLPMLADIAEERDYIFIFSDVKKMADNTMNDRFNSLVHSVIVLDNIAEFVSESGQKTVLSDLDLNTLKADYAKCEFGDGYYYDVEADDLKKLKFIQEEE